MPINTKLYNLLISCPGDITTERQVVKEVVERFNHVYSEYAGVTLLIKHWSTDAFPESGGKPQELLNKQLVDNCDAAVAIFWTRFGSPTGKYDSGTEEEIERMLESKKQVFLYFSDKPISPSKQDTEGYKKISSFREKYSDKGIYWTFSSDEEFSKILFAHLSKFFLGKAQTDEYREYNRSDLKLLGIDKNGELSEKASLYQFVLNSTQSVEAYKTQIIGLFQDISKMNVGKRTESKDNLLFAVYAAKDPVRIKDEDQKIIRDIAKVFDYSLPDSFFELGNLSENATLKNFPYGGGVVGTDMETDKYNKINDLIETITNMSKWVPIESAFYGKKCIRLALQNCGRAYDEDVEVSMLFPASSIESIKSIAQFDKNGMNYLLTECDVGELFTIRSTADYLGYSASKPDKGEPIQMPTPMPILGYAPDYSDAFFSELQDTYCYSVYQKGEQCIVKLKFNYIKHNTVVAFPSAIFLKNKIPSIPYKITSKNNPDVIEGTLIIE